MDRTAMRGSTWREADRPCDRMVTLPDLPRRTGRPQPVHLLLARLLRDALDARLFRQGERLPSSGTMAVRFGCSEDTVRRAVAVLVAQGYVERVPHCGVYVKGVPGPHSGAVDAR